MGSLWANLDFSGARRPLRYYQLRVCMKRAQGRTIQATLNRHALSLSKVLGTLMSECGTLEHLTILDDVDLKTIYNDLLSAKDLTTLLIPNCMVPLDAVMSILRASHRLVRAEFGGICRANMGSLWPERLDNLRTLKLNAMRPLGGQLRNLVRISQRSRVLQMLTSLSQRGFLSMMPNITKLAMTKFNYLKIPVDPQPDYSTLKFLEHIDLSDSGLPSSVPLPASIRHVFLNGVPDMELPRLMGEEAESTNLKFLETLEVGHNIDMKARMLIPILDPSRGVRKRVSLFRCISIYDEDIRELAESGILEDIEHLNLGETGVRDDGIAFIANAAPNLIRLNLSSTGVSGVGVKALLSRPDSKLACLNLDGCMSVNIDAVEWARSKGVHVQFQFVEKAGSGKKVRYG
ncbi:MAG: hypothetical protein M4579_002893 [Chaenotheca gracillima]|nr:MAG: hypothetical protein M4579_002893 [Chaenotheca gracillima]